MFGVGPSTSFVGMSRLFRAKRKKPSRPFHAILKNIVGNRRDRSMLYPFINEYSPEPSATVRNRSWSL